MRLTGEQGLIHNVLITATSPLSLTRWSMLEKPTHLFISCVIVPLLKEEETWNHGNTASLFSSREQREQGESQRDIQAWFRNQTSRRQIATQPPAHSCYHITVTLSVLSLPAEISVPRSPVPPCPHRLTGSGSSNPGRASLKQHVAQSEFKKTISNAW